MSLSISSISQFIIGVAVTLQFADVITGHLKKSSPSTSSQVSPSGLEDDPWFNAFLAAIVGGGFFLVAECLSRLNILPTRVSAIFHDRALNAHQNWDRHFRRSVVEAGIAVASSWAAANHLSTGIALSVGIGITAAIGTVFVCHSLDIFTSGSSAGSRAVEDKEDDSSNEVHQTSMKPLRDSNKADRVQTNSSQKEGTAQLPSFTWEEVAKHSSRESCWIVVHGYVYDLTSWLDRHPGGILPILNCAGDVDATDVFISNHPPKVVNRILPAFRIGRLEGYTVSPATAEFRKLVADMEASGWFETDLTYYLGLAVWYGLLLAGAVYSVVILQSAILGGLLLGFVWQQAAFTGHDLGHNAVFHDKARDDHWAVFVGNFLGGISIGWWKATHNVHHVATNSISCDPDIQHMPVLAVSEKIVRAQDQKGKGLWSTYHEKYFKLDFIAKNILPRQHYLYYIVMLFARFNLYLQSVLLLTSDRRTRLMKGVKSPKWELCALAGFALWYTYLVSFLPTTSGRIGFIVLSHAVAGILHIQITLSHFAMPTYEVSERPLKVEAAAITDEVDHPAFVAHQLKTSLDISCPWWMDWFHGGLQFQAAHHVFPRSPRHKARQLSMILKRFCNKYGIVYNEVGFIEANRMVLTTLSNVALDTHNFIKEMANLQG
ncbi:Delta 8 Fatty Acid Desaturase [Perkinsus chesapeaki]|uniref:Delta 8 Fatty Acid Desaturase n=1 Tax=Perkinsus chesapeaki TaxID=330153 RepID=A0A7J6MGY6_PERCH|nr:Delta 8 Fatty Acid Desaturase [Perkinsus chesapeaki]